jgi:Ca2+/Na+ antiporter
MDALFIDVSTFPHDGYGAFQLVFITIVYGFILYKASKLIADGAELLTLIMDAGFVGAVVLPVLGAVPDGAIVLFSGMGPADLVAKEMPVGVGTLAGSTIMLLTIPWLASIVMGRVDLAADGKSALYKTKAKQGNKFSLFRSGVESESDVRVNAWIMVGTTISYFVIQGPDWAGKTSETGSAALATLILSAVLFVAYCGYQLYSSRSQDFQRLRAVEARKKAFANHVVDLATLAIIEEQTASDPTANNVALKSVVGGEVTSAALRKIFDQYDTDKSGELSKSELKAMFKELGYRIAADELDAILVEIGGADRLVQFDEFERAMSVFIRERVERREAKGNKTLRSVGLTSKPVSRQASLNGGTGTGAAAALLPTAHSSMTEEEEEEEEEEEDENEHMTPAQIRMRAFLTLLLGVGLVTFFSDPMVSAIGEIGTRSNIPPFVLSFIVTPLVSNASELISSIMFAGRKTSKSITMTFSALLGAATMNNTLCLAIFAALVYFKNLEWTYGPQVTVIILVQVAVGVLASFRVTPLYMGFVALALYPLSLIIVQTWPAGSS